MADLTYLLLWDHFFFFKNIWFLTGLKTQRWEALREDSFYLLAICSWSLSLAHFILLAKSWASSGACPSFSWAIYFFWQYIDICVAQYWNNKMLNLWALVLGFSSLFRGYLTAYWRPHRETTVDSASSSANPKWWATVVSVRPGISYFLSFTMTKLRTLRLASIYRFVLSPVLLGL